jgi:hypothetical protein
METAKLSSEQIKKLEDEAKQLSRSILSKKHTDPDTVIFDTNKDNQINWGIILRSKVPTNVLSLPPKVGILAMGPKQTKVYLYSKDPEGNRDEVVTLFLREHGSTVISGKFGEQKRLAALPFVLSNNDGREVIANVLIPCLREIDKHLSKNETDQRG